MDTLQDRIAEAEQRFNELSKQRDEINLEMTKLQGEWRVLNDLLTEEKPDEVNKKDAEVIEVIPEEEGIES